MILSVFARFALGSMLAGAAAWTATDPRIAEAFGGGAAALEVGFLGGAVLCALSIISLVWGSSR